MDGSRINLRILYEMTENQENNIDNPLPHDMPYTAMEAIQAINRLMWSDGVEGDDYAEALVVKSFLVGTLPNTPVPVKHSKTIPVMETTIEGAQIRITKAIEDYAARCKFIGDPRETNPDLEYIAVFLDTVGDEMAAISTAHESLHDRYEEALAAIAEWKDNFEAVDMASARRLEEKDELKKEIDILKATIASLERQLLAAHDNR